MIPPHLQDQINANVADTQAQAVLSASLPPVEKAGTGTPETDAACWMQNWEGYRGEIINSNFCRRLERERDAARADADRLAFLLDGCDPGVLGLAAMACQAGKITEKTNNEWHTVFIQIREAIVAHKTLKASQPKQ